MIIYHLPFDISSFLRSAKMWGLVIYYTLTLWAPIAALIHLPNVWWGLIGKAVAVLWLWGAIGHFLKNPALIGMIGSAGAGFVLNGVWFAILNFRLPYWARISLCFLIITTLWTCKRIIEKMMVNPSDELDQITKSAGIDYNKSYPDDSKDSS